MSPGYSAERRPRPGEVLTADGRNFEVRATWAEGCVGYYLDELEPRSLRCLGWDELAPEPEPETAHG